MVTVALLPIIPPRPPLGIGDTSSSKHNNIESLP